MLRMQYTTSEYVAVRPMMRTLRPLQFAHAGVLGCIGVIVAPLLRVPQVISVVITVVSYGVVALFAEEPGMHVRHS